MTLDIEQARHAMIEQQIRPWEVVDMRVLQTLAAIPRERFVPEQHRALAFADTALPIGHGQSMFKPVLEGRMLQAAGIQANDEVLEIGTGSGFITACLAHLARAVTSIDIHPDFLESAKDRLQALDLNNVRFELADALAYQPKQQFDAVLVTGAVAAIPEAFKRWLRPGGRLFVIHGLSPVQEALCMTREGDSFAVQSLLETDVPYLTGAQPEPKFTF